MKYGLLVDEKEGFATLWINVGTYDVIPVHTSRDRLHKLLGQNVLFILKGEKYEICD